MPVDEKQFNQILDAVMSKVPPGLTEEQFNKILDAEVAKADKENDTWSNLEGMAGEGGGYHPTGMQTAAGLAGLAGGAALSVPGVPMAIGAGAAEYGIEKLPKPMQWPARIAGGLMFGGAKSKLFKMATKGLFPAAEAAATTEAPAAATGARQIFNSLSEKAIRSPQEEQQFQQLMRMFTQEAKEKGMANAARGAVR